jgi:hypothetical protein
MNISPAVLFKLGKFSSLKTTELTLDHAHEIAGVLGFDLHKETLQGLVDLVNSDDPQQFAEWVFNPENVDKLKNELGKAKETATTLIACPKCNDINVLPVMAIPQLHPHIVCRHCQTVVELGE